MEDEEVIELETIRSGDVLTRLKEKTNDGYKISIVIKKSFNFSNQLSVMLDSDAPTTTKNETGPVSRIVPYSPRQFGPNIDLNKVREATQPSDGDFDRIFNSQSNKHIESNEQSPMPPLYRKKNVEKARNRFFKRQKQTIQEIVFLLEEVDNRMKVADEYFQEGKWHEAKLLYAKSLESIENHILSDHEKISNQKHFILLGIKSLVQQGICNQKLGNHSAALQCFKKCFKRFSVNEPDTHTKILIEIGQSLFELRRYNDSLDYFAKALRIFETLNWQVQVAEVLLKMAIIYALYDLFSEAKRMAYHARDLLRTRVDFGDPRQVDVWFTLGTIHFFAKEYQFSLEHYRSGLEISLTNTASNHQTLRLLNSLGITHQAMGWPTKAIVHYKEALECTKEQKHQLIRAQINSNLGVAMVESNEINLGTQCLTEAIKVYEEHEHPSLKRATTNMRFMRRMVVHEPTESKGVHRSCRSV